MPMTPEKAFENRVKTWFHSIGVYPAGYPKQKMKYEAVGWYFKVWGGGFQKSGIPDVIVCANGVFVAVELKSKNGHASDLQKLNIRRINEANGIGVILWPDGFNEFKKLIREVIDCDSHIRELSALRTVHSSTKCDILTES